MPLKSKDFYFRNVCKSSAPRRVLHQKIKGGAESAEKVHERNDMRGGVLAKVVRRAPRLLSSI